MVQTLTHIDLTRFRNFEKSAFEIGPDLTLIIGENARGKTSLLESIYTIIYGTGFRETREIELVKWDTDENLIEGFFQDSEHTNLFQVRMQKADTSRVKKMYFVNKTHKTAAQYRTMQSQAVLFAPEQIQIITGSPSRRRRYFDEVLSAVDPTYRKSLRQYETALRTRNKVLENYENELSLVSEIAFWDAFLIEHAAYITTKRKEYTDYLNEHPDINGKHFTTLYRPDVFSEERIAEVRAREYRLRRTVIGPQKDDVTLFLNEPTKKNVSHFGSRSEQRMAIFWLKLNELLYFEKMTHAKPILLLDDIFSELDEHNRKLVMSVIKEYQTIATTTDEDIKDLSQMPEVVIRL